MRPQDLAWCAFGAVGYLAVLAAIYRWAVQ